MTNRRRCAVYTRKSTEDGLDQEFNSLDAQREACSAYILSQASEGWEAVSGQYDDGGFSGGSMNRPALQKLLEAVKTGQIDVIVVYKVDRLTRSLADFAKIVEILDEHEASFVSVTQSFNTTNSMGRLTLNVLLSFAQFEREVTGERIRDKIAASKKKGMWMGGNVPMGYVVENRKLIVDQKQAETVQHIFRRYLELRSVPALELDLAQSGVKSPRRKSRSGKHLGGCPLTRGAITHILNNRIYVGKIMHQGKAHEGEHSAIIDSDLFDRVQRQIDANRLGRRNGDRVEAPSLMPGLVLDGLGRPMTPCKTQKRNRSYRYYASRCKTAHDKQHPIWRVPAPDLEEIVIGKLCSFLNDEAALQNLAHDGNPDGLKNLFASAQRSAEKLTSADAHARRKLLLTWLDHVVVEEQEIKISIDSCAMIPELASTEHSEKHWDLVVPASIIRNGKQTRIAISPSSNEIVVNRDPSLIKLIAKAWQARCTIEASGSGMKQAAKGAGYVADYFARLVRLGYLAPDIIDAIVQGKQPASLTRQKLARLPSLPVSWSEQRALLGFTAT